MQTTAVQRTTRPATIRSKGVFVSCGPPKCTHDISPPLSPTLRLSRGKASLWEGGVRGVGFLTTGNPSKVRNLHPLPCPARSPPPSPLKFGLGPRMGGIYNGLMHVSDWFPTFCELAGCGWFGISKKQIAIATVCSHMFQRPCPPPNSRTRPEWNQAAGRRQPVGAHRE